MIGQKMVCSLYRVTSSASKIGTVEFTFISGEMRVIFDDGTEAIVHPDGKIPSWGPNAYWEWQS